MSNDNVKGVLQKKLIKKKNLYDAALELFLTKGIHDTVIDDIVKKAGVAKGTFYLYFKDKYDIIDRLILDKSFIIIKQAVNEIEKIKSERDLSFDDTIIYFVEYIIDYFKEDKKLLRLIYKNLSWGIFKKALNDTEHHEDVKNIVYILKSDFEKYSISAKDIEKKLYIIIELAGSVVYSAIILEDPFTIDEIKPVLLNSIKKIIV